MSSGKEPALNPTNVLRITLAVLLVLRFGGTFASYALSGTYLNLQDRWLLLLELALAAAALWAPLPARLPRIGPRAMVAIAVLLVAVCWAGHWLVMRGYDLSRDEQMAVFDARIYAAGRMAWPLPVAWRPDAAMLNLLFMLPVDRPVAWVSAYLPGNSLLRAAVGLVVDPALTGPLLTAGSALLLWRIARRFWPEDDAAVSVSVLALVLSGQVVFAGMTAYAMPAHLFCTLLWLWLFLKDRAWADALAIAVAAFATGLHQPLFHPLMVAPWLIWLATQRGMGARRWGRLLVYGMAYAAVCGFWLWYPHWLHAVVSRAGSSTATGTGYLERLRDVLTTNHQNLAMMACNLVRFCTWQALPVVPLLVAGLWAALQTRDGRALALAAGFIAPIVFFAVALPYQGHGFGYRYVHQAMGNVALLAGFGWQALRPWQARLERDDKKWVPVFVINHATTRNPERDDVSFKRHHALEAAVVRGFALGLVVLMPVQGWFTHGIYAPFAAASARIAGSGADYAIVGAGDGPYALDLVLNRPDLANRPIRLSAGEIDDSDALAARLCDGAHPGRVAVAMPDDSFFDDISAYFHAARMGAADARLPDQSRAFRQAGCRVIRMSGAGNSVLAQE